MQPGMLRTDPRIIKAGRYGIDRGDLPVFILAEVGLHPVKDPQSARRDGGGCFEGIHTPAGSLAADQPYVLILNKVVEASDGIGTSADTGQDRVGKPALLFASRAWPSTLLILCAPV